jgi:hypothetical protein
VAPTAMSDMRRSPQRLRVSDRGASLLAPMSVEQALLSHQPANGAVRDRDVLPVELQPDLAGP